MDEQRIEELRTERWMVACEGLYYMPGCSAWLAVRTSVRQVGNFHLLPNITQSQCKSMREREIS